MDEPNHQLGWRMSAWLSVLKDIAQPRSVVYVPMRLASQVLTVNIYVDTRPWAGILVLLQSIMTEPFSIALRIAGLIKLTTDVLTADYN